MIMKIVDEGFENLGDPSWLRIEGLIKRPNLVDKKG